MLNIRMSRTPIEGSPVPGWSLRLSELRQTEVLFKVGTSSYNWSTIGRFNPRVCMSTASWTSSVS